MVVRTSTLKANRLQQDFEIISKLGEGTFGEAFQVRSHLDGQLYAVKRAKEQYLGYKDREQKLQEVFKALKLTSSEFMNQQSEDDWDTQFYKRYCVKVKEAWEEGGYLFIQSELCEKGNLNDYLLELGQGKS